MINWTAIQRGTLLVIALGGCATMGEVRGAPPCYDGWTDTGTYISKLLPTDTDEYRKIVSTLSQYKVYCVHQTTPTLSKFMAVVSIGNDPDLFGIVLQKQGDKFNITDKGIIG